MRALLLAVCIVVTDRAALEQAICECCRKIRLRLKKVLPGTYAHPDRNELAEPMEPVRQETSLV